MPHVLQMQKQGLTFTNYFVTDSLCCPSRSSIFTGKFPHDTHVFTNGNPNGGYAKFQSAGNANQTYATAIAAANYQVGILGKYLNGYNPAVDNADPGFTEWAAAGEGYPEYNYTINVNGKVINHGNSPNDYLTTVLERLATTYLSSVGANPFVLEIATFAPHVPYTPAPQDENTMSVVVPRIQSYDVANLNPPTWLSLHTPLTQGALRSFDAGFNLRAEAVQAVDRLLGSVLATLETMGVANNTYVIFNSDNGYHMGEHMLSSGKQTAFDTDIHVPLIVTGPGVNANSTVDYFASNIDLCATFADLTGGRSSKHDGGPIAGASNLWA